MRNLIRAEFYRYRVNRLSPLLIAAAFLCGMVYGLDVIVNDYFEDIFIVPLFILQAVFLSIEVGQEYGDGTIRSKIIAGYTRAEIYGSKLIASIFASLAVTTVYLIPVAVISAIVLWGTLSQIPILIILLGFYLLNFVWAALFCTVSLLISKREVSSLVNIALIIIIFLGAYQFESMLGQPETYTEAEYVSVEMTAEEVSQLKDGTFTGSYSILTEDDGTVTYYKEVLEGSDEAVKNPRYIGEPLRTVLTAADAVFPTGQINHYVDYLSGVSYSAELDLDVDDDVEEYGSFYTYPLYSLAAIVIISVAGLLIFRKKDLA